MLEMPPILTGSRLIEYIPTWRVIHLSFSIDFDWAIVSGLPSPYFDS